MKWLRNDIEGLEFLFCVAKELTSFDLDCFSLLSGPERHLFLILLLDKEEQS